MFDWGCCGYICNEREPQKPKRFKDLRSLLAILYIFGIIEVLHTSFTLLFCVFMIVADIVISLFQTAACLSNQEHTRYIRHNKPQLTYALHILNNKHEYGPISNTMALLKHNNKTSLLLPYKQLYIQSYHQHMQLISEQYIGEHDPIYHLIHNTFNTSLPTRPTKQYPTINTTKSVSSWTS